MKDIVIQRGMHQAARGRVRCLVVDGKTKRVKRDYGWQNNLILNQGLDFVAQRIWVANFAVAVAGTGTVPTNDDSGATVAAQSGTTVNLSGGTFTFTDSATDLGKTIKWDSGQTAQIVSVQSPTSVTVLTSATVAAGEFTVYRTAQTGLYVERKRTTTLLTGTGNCGTTFDFPNGTATMRRTFDFSLEAAPITYTEVGLSWTTDVGLNLFSRIRLASDVVCTVGDQLRLVYELVLTVTPYVKRAINPVITGWNNTQAEEVFGTWPTYTVDVNGTSWVSTAGGGVGEPGTLQSGGYYQNRFTMSDNSDDPIPAAMASGELTPTFYGTNNYAGALTIDSYTAGSWTVNKRSTLLPSQGVMNGIRTLTLGTDVGGYGRTYYPSHVVRFANPQNKTNIQTLVLLYKLTWSRVLA